MTPPTDPTRWPEVKRLFEAALGLPPAEREGFLHDACRTPAGAVDEGLLASVRVLLDADEEAETEDATGFLGTPALSLHALLDGLGVELVGREAGVGVRVGPYRLLRLLGRGGMGEVYLAERADGLFERTVALKRVRPDLAPAVAARFSAERQILADLVHPGIARLYGAGTDDDGRPWLAMEPVDGVPLAAFAEARGLSRRARIGLMLQVCAAVHHAHQRLVVHRDLKPSNVLVVDGTDGPHVRLLDFGIAQILGADGDGLLTRAYASPEQLRGEPATTASDVYGLGGLLVETLTGARPAGPDRAGSPRLGPEAGDLPGDLGSIARKALAPEPADRYASAEALADDLRRWLDGRPVLAHASSPGYRARRFLGRHRVPAAVAAVALAVLALAGTVAGLRVVAERERAQQAAADAEAVAEAQSLILRVLNPAFRAELDSTGAASFAAVVDDAVAAAEAAYADHPAVLGRQLATLATTLRERGQTPRADTLYARALALRLPLGRPGDPVVHEALVGRGLIARAREDWGEAQTHFREALALERAHPALAPGPTSRTELYLASVLPDHADRERALVRVLAAQRAAPGADTALATARAHSELGAYYRDKRLFREAFDEYLAAERIVRGRRGELHPEVNELRVSLSFTAAGMGRYAEAESHARIALGAARRAGLGPLREAALRQAIGQALFYQYRADEAAAELREAAAQFEAALGPTAPQTLGALKSLAVVETKRGENAAALAVTERVLAVDLAGGGAGKPPALQMEARAAGLRFGLGERREALADLLGLVGRAPPAGSSDFHRVEILWVAGEALRASGRAAEALPLHREAVALSGRLIPEGHLIMRSHRLSLGRTLAALGRHAEARPHLEFARGFLDSYPVPDPLDDVDTEIDRLLAQR